jgi:tripartite-type tricarboxylate transporter receptor subunit TctC
MVQARKATSIWRVRLNLLALLAGIPFGPVSLAADYPARTVSIIVPFAAGGGNDVQARLLAKDLAGRLGKPVVVENRPGAGGHIAAQLVAHAAPDGHTLLFCSTGSLVFGSVIRGLDPLDEFSPITVITEMPLVLVPSPSLAANTLPELIALAKRKPGELTYASAGPGSFLHLATEMFKASTQTDIVHVPYKGEAAAIVDIIGGRVSWMFMTPPFAIPQIRAGKLRALGVTGRRRIPALPDVPTLAEKGIAGLDTPVLWFGIAAPKGTPGEIIERLNKESVAVVRSPEFIRALENQGIFVIGESTNQFTQRVRADTASIAKLVKAINLRLEE